MRDPRLRLALVITSLQVLGQVALGFDLSIAQIVLPILACALVEVAVTWRRTGSPVWPASAMLTGNSVAFLLRAPGTRHGDWWSLHGIQFFLLAALVGLVSKWVIRYGRRHLYNPSNLGLVLVLLLFGPSQVVPQFLWWGPLGWPVALALAVIAAGGLWILRPLGMLPMVVAYLGTFWVLLWAIVYSGRCFLAVWHPASVCGSDYWLNVSLSPEVLIFVFFMISDPQTAPRLPAARLAYGALVAAAGAGLMVLQPSEFGVKLAILAGLTVICPFVPLLDAGVARARASLERGRAAFAVLCGSMLVSFWVAVGVLTLASNLNAIERDLPAPAGCSPSAAQAGACP